MSNTASERAAHQAKAPDVSGTRPAVRGHETHQALIGPTLEDVFASWSTPVKGAKPPLGERLSLVVDTLLALDQLHDNSDAPKQARLHGNLHPGTIVVGLSGVVNLLLERTTDTDDARKWIGYRAPELLLRKYPASLATDVFAVGALLYQCVTTRPMYPMRAPKAVFASIKQRSHHTPEELSAEEKRVLRVVEQATSYQPRARYRSAKHMLRGLLDALGYMPQQRVQVAAYACQKTGLKISAADASQGPVGSGSISVNLRKPTFPKAPSLPSFAFHAMQPTILGPEIDSSTLDAGPESIAGPCPTPVEHIEQLTEEDRMPAERPSNRPTAAAPSWKKGPERNLSPEPQNGGTTQSASKDTRPAPAEVAERTTECLDAHEGLSNSDPTTLFQSAELLDCVDPTEMDQGPKLLTHLASSKRESQPVPRVLSAQTLQPKQDRTHAVVGFLKGAAAVFALAASAYFFW